MHINPFRTATIVILTFSVLGFTSAQEKDKRVDWSEKRIIWEMREKRWSDVLTWFADQAQMPYSSSSYTPTGTFTFVGAKDKDGKPRAYSLVEIHDILNEVLQGQHKYILVRDENVLRLIALDDDRWLLVPRVELGDLAQRGRTEMVEIVLKVKPGVNLDEVAPEVFRVLRPFGQVTPVPGQTLVIRASVGSLQRNLDVILDLVAPPAVVSPLPPADPACQPRARAGLFGRLLRR